MCGIFYWKGQDCSTTLALQEDRGLDWVGITYIKDNKLYTKQFFLAPHLLTDYIREIDDYIIEHDLLQTNMIMHHRKASVWGVTEGNTHPFTFENFLIYQNGTDRDWVDWLKLDMWWGDQHVWKTDTYALGRYISQRAKTIEKALDVVKDISQKVKIWAIFLVERKSWKVLFYSDTDRETVVDFENNNQKYTLNTISNYHLMDWKGNNKYENNCWIIFNLLNWGIKKISGNITNTQIKRPKYNTFIYGADSKKKVVTPTNTTSIIWPKKTGQNTTKTNGVSTMQEVEDILDTMENSREAMTTLENKIYKRHQFSNLLTNYVGNNWGSHNLRVTLEDDITTALQDSEDLLNEAEATTLMELYLYRVLALCCVNQSTLWKGQSTEEIAEVVLKYLKVVDLSHDNEAMKALWTATPAENLRFMHITTYLHTALLLWGDGFVNPMLIADNYKKSKAFKILKNCIENLKNERKERLEYYWDDEYWEAFIDSEYWNQAQKVAQFIDEKRYKDLIEQMEFDDDLSYTYFLLEGQKSWSSFDEIRNIIFFKEQKDEKKC